MHLDRDRSSGISQIERIQAEIQRAERKRSNSVTAAAQFDKVVSTKQLGGKQREGASRTFDVRIDDFNIASVHKNATREAIVSERLSKSSWHARCVEPP